jgi:hypothetical protein
VVASRPRAADIFPNAHSPCLSPNSCGISGFIIDPQIGCRYILLAHSAGLLWGDSCAPSRRPTLVS